MPTAQADHGRRRPVVVGFAAAASFGTASGRRPLAHAPEVASGATIKNLDPNLALWLLLEYGEPEICKTYPGLDERPLHHRRRRGVREVACRAAGLGGGNPRLPDPAPRCVMAKDLPNLERPKHVAQAIRRCRGFRRRSVLAARRSPPCRLEVPVERWHAYNDPARQAVRCRPTSPKHAHDRSCDSHRESKRTSLPERQISRPRADADGAGRALARMSPTDGRSSAESTLTRLSLPRERSEDLSARLHVPTICHHLVAY
jgi:hypothetical protein